MKTKNIVIMLSAGVIVVVIAMVFLVYSISAKNHSLNPQDSESQNTAQIGDFKEAKIIYTEVQTDNGNEIKNTENLILRTPYSVDEMKEFVKPEEALAYIPKSAYSYKGDVEYSLDKIAGYSIDYRDDFYLFGQDEYWQTPAETISRGEGDCEDWAVAVLSMMKAYKADLKCYNLVLNEHVSVICYFNNTYIIYDQDRLKKETKVFSSDSEHEKEIKIQRMINKYFSEFGFNLDERDALGVFNDKEAYAFQTNDEFISWLASLSD